jgi:GT2 family glycosyltransferase
LNEQPKKLAVLMPGSTFSNRWVAELMDLYCYLLTKYHLRMSWAEGNNIYLTRENCLVQAMHDPHGPPDYLLWIDSDNPPSREGFELLMAAMDASSEVSAVGGWYRFFVPTSLDVHLAVGARGPDGKCCYPPEEQILNSDHLIEVEFIGFGFCLMRASVINDIGLHKCFEPLPLDPPRNGRTWCTDDDGFFARARAAGHRVFVHPAVFVEHEKRMNVPGRIESPVQIPMKELV